MNRLMLVLASVVALSVVSIFGHQALAQAASFPGVTVAPAGGVQYVEFQYNYPGVFDRGSCELSCRDRYSGSSTWTGDRTQSGPSMDYLRCSSQCDIRYWNHQERSRKLY